MNSYRYPIGTLVADYLRAAAGVFLPLALMIFTELLPLFFYIMCALVLLFAFYGLRTIRRQSTVIIVDGDGIRQEGPLGGVFDRSVRWSEVADFHLRYYSTRRDGSDGWMHLILRDANGGRIRLDSNLPGFDGIVGRAHAVALDRGLSIDPTSATNLAAIGLGAEEIQTATSTPLDKQYPS